jgi:ABC-type bacteriocin/lantibiotic exporter with double-glycine peptidase domain
MDFWIPGCGFFLKGIIMRQKNLKDCGICCLAMIMDKGYHAVKRDVLFAHRQVNGPRQFNGTTQDIDMLVLWKNGIRADTVEAEPSGYRIRYTKKGPLIIYEKKKKNDLKKLLFGKRAILTCPSLNFHDLYHAVYWDGERLHDPSNLKRYNKGRAFKTAIRAVFLVE